MAAIVRRRTTPLEAAITRLTSGHGSQRLPAALRSIEILNVPSKGGRKGQKAFLKTVIPRIKFHNNALEINTHWIKIPDRKKRGKKDGDVAPESASKDVAGPSKAPFVRLNFDELPPQDLRLGHKSVTEITREMLSLIQSTLKTPLEEVAAREEETTSTSDEADTAEEMEEVDPIKAEAVIPAAASV
ncbi:hypothetical protein CBS101457_003971 [Exobasidium rhododendri]|nr:hypothetical protein CBS101457_003971 [Exobasidium rhododendri]